MTPNPDLRAALLHCPFCDSPAEISTSRDGEVCNVRCSKWEPDSCLGAGPNMHSEAEAITAWNTRAPQSAPAPAGWRSISSAPRDGSRVLIEWSNLLHEKHPYIAYLDGAEEWRLDSGGRFGSQPDLWQPLPGCDIAQPLPAAPGEQVAVS